MVSNTAILSLLLFFCVGMHAQSDLSTKDSEFEVHHFYFEGKKLPFRLLQPLNAEKGKTYPLVVFLHGAGSRGDDNSTPLTHIRGLFNEQTRKDFPCYLLVPQCPKGHRWVETDWTLPAHTQPEEVSMPMGMTIELLKHIQHDYAVDSNRIYLTGLSMGGFGTWDLLARRPNTFAAAAPICGGADPATAPLIKDIPIWCFHGDRDRAVMVKRSRDMVKALKAIDGNIKYTEYQGVGHGSWKPAYLEPNFMSWLFSHQKNND